MADLPTPEENSIRVLRALVRRFDMRPGHVLQPNNIWVLQTKEGMTSEDANAGLKHAIGLDWFELVDGVKLRLTEAGFAAA